MRGNESTCSQPSKTISLMRNIFTTRIPICQAVPALSMFRTGYAIEEVPAITTSHLDSTRLDAGLKGGAATENAGVETRLKDQHRRWYSFSRSKLSKLAVPGK